VWGFISFILGSWLLSRAIPDRRWDDVMRRLFTNSLSNYTWFTYSIILLFKVTPKTDHCSQSRCEVLSTCIRFSPDQTLLICSYPTNKTSFAWE
jgi:hypothetical protein